MAHNVLGRHLALVGFMGAGKSTVASELAALLGRPLVDLDSELEEELGSPIFQVFAERGVATEFGEL